MPPTYTGGDSPTDKDGKSKLLKALQQHNLDRKKRENITGKGRIPVVRSSKSSTAGGGVKSPAIKSSKSSTAGGGVKSPAVKSSKSDDKKDD